MSKILSKLEGTSWKVTAAGVLAAGSLAIVQHKDTIPEYPPFSEWLVWVANVTQYFGIVLMGLFARDDDVSSEGTKASKSAH